MKEIPLTRGKVALVDDEDYERVSQFKWHARTVTGENWYAARAIRKNEPGFKGGYSVAVIMLHRFILSDVDWPQIDHRNGDGLDNQRHNLRCAEQTQNNWNRGKGRNNTSGFKGVSRHGAKWRADIYANKTHFYLGSFTSAEEAARAYDAKAKELHAEFAYLNFPKEGSVL